MEPTRVEQIRRHETAIGCFGLGIPGLLDIVVIKLHVYDFSMYDWCIGIRFQSRRQYLPMLIQLMPVHLSKM